jgi:hypothetical protein
LFTWLDESTRTACAAWSAPGTTLLIVQRFTTKAPVFGAFFICV